MDYQKLAAGDGLMDGRLGFLLTYFMAIEPSQKWICVGYEPGKPRRCLWETREINLSNRCFCFWTVHSWLLP